MPVIHAARALTPEGWKSDVRLTIEGDAIVTIETGVAPRAGDERCAIAAPAIANLHSHAFQRGMAGLAEFRGEQNDTFWTWRETMYRFALAMSPDDVEAVAAQLYVEMLEAGFAAVAEFHYLHHAPDGSPYAARAEMAGRIVAAARRAGIGLTLLPVFYAHATFGGAPPKPEQRRFVNDVSSFARLVEDCRALVKDFSGGAVGVAPHSLRAATPSELDAIIGLAGQAPIHIHAAEQVKEVEDCLAWSGARPVQWLLDHAAVDSRWCLVHATHMDADETRRLARAGAVAGLCPVTEANLGDGVFNAPDFGAHGGVYGIGTDSNVLIGVAAELRQLEYAQRLRDRARNVCAAADGSTGRALYDAASAGGAQALARRSGRLAPGASADIVTLRADHPLLAGRSDDQILDAWIFSVGNPLVDCVWSGGRKLVVDGRHCYREEIGAKFAAAMRGLCAR
ncbi:MAG: formimidoylglutamate deiminase [Roseiarcus sp.]